MPHRPLQRLVWCVAACGASNLFLACSLWLDWNGYTDAGQAAGSSNGVESGAGSGDSSVKESGGGIDARVDASDATDGSDGPDGNGADAGDGGGGPMDAYAVDVSNPCVTHTCGGCCDTNNICNFGTHIDSCGINGGPCSKCASNESCTNRGTCSSSPTGFTPPSCVGGDASSCPPLCGPPPFGLPVCCRPDQTCSCFELITMHCL